MENDLESEALNQEGRISGANVENDGPIIIKTDLGIKNGQKNALIVDRQISLSN